MSEQNYGAIEWLVGHLFHVGDSDLKVAREMLKRGKAGKLPKETRKEFARVAVEFHRANRKLYRDVMTGNL